MSSDTQNSRKCASPRRTNLSSSVGLTICSKLAHGTSKTPGCTLVAPAMRPCASNTCGANLVRAASRTEGDMIRVGLRPAATHWLLCERPGAP